MKIIETNLKFNSNHSTRSGNPNGIVLHHAAANGSVYDVHNWHLGNGWAGIGYHFYVRKDGSVYRGRPENWVGAHTSGHNSTKLGICAEGNFETDTMPEVQKKAIIELLVYLFGKYGTLKVYRHRDLDATACPGKNYPFDAIVNGANNPGKAEEEVKGNDSTEPEYTLKQFIKEVQSACGAAVDGIAGSETISKTVTLSAHKNAYHAAVRAVQKRLTALGYAEVGKVDGIAGVKFTSAVAHFQQDNGCVVDGEITAGHKTWRKLLGME